VGIFTVDKEHNLVSYSKGKDIEVSSDGLVFENLSHLEVKRVKDLNFLQSKKNNTSYQINLDKSELYSFKDDVKTMDMIQLIVSLNAKVKSGLNSNEILYEIMSRIIKPFTLLSMVLIALPLILTQDRAISLGNKIFIAISIGVITHLLIKISSVIAIKINVISYIGPLIPTVVLTLTGLVLLKRNLKKIY